MKALVHETAFVEPGSTLGDDTKVWHHSQVRTDASVGARCVLGKNVFVDFEVQIGSGCKIQNNVSIFHGVTIEDDVFVGPAVTFTNDLVPRAFASDWSIFETRVRHGCSIGANATIICGIDIGEFAMVGAGAVVTKNVAPHSLVVGNPARLVGWVCECGILVSRLAERPSDTHCERCKGESK